MHPPSTGSLLKPCKVSQHAANVLTHPRVAPNTVELRSSYCESSCECQSWKWSYDAGCGCSTTSAVVLLYTPLWYGYSLLCATDAVSSHVDADRDLLCLSDDGLVFGDNHVVPCIIRFVWCNEPAYATDICKRAFHLLGVRSCSETKQPSP